MLLDIRAILIDAVLAGARCVLDARRTGSVGTRYKTAAELVTDADEQADAAMRAILEARLHALDAGISLRLEESGSSGSPGRRHVGADPLDGTSHFAAGGNLYSVQA